ncbi:MAG: hypothetical protein V1793_00865 [Pseudomonadota bacterium]
MKWTGKMKLLVCDISGEMHGMVQESDAMVVNSPVHCLNQAIAGNPNTVVIRFGDFKFRERDALIDLCSVLKQNQYTKSIEIIALLSSRHRVVMERLRHAGVDYVKFLAKVDPSQASIDITAHEPEPRDQLNYQLEILCPYLCYSKIDSRHEMTVCGAYLDRLVLGGQRLHEICETQGHHHCEYYMNPRCSS